MKRRGFLQLLAGLPVAAIAKPLPALEVMDWGAAASSPALGELAAVRSLQAQFRDEFIAGFEQHHSLLREMAEKMVNPPLMISDDGKISMLKQAGIPEEWLEVPK